MKRRYKVVTLFLALLMIFSCFTVGSVYAAGESPYDTLKKHCKAAELPTGQDKKASTIQKTQYKKSGGGFYLYIEITGSTTDSACFIESYYTELTAGARQDFLRDYIYIAQAWEAYYKEHRPTNSQNMITNETVTDLMDELQNISGAGSQLMATLLENTKPDFTTANRIYKPFSGIVGTVLGVISILIMSLLGVTMALDLAYIVIPMFQLFLDGGEGGDGQNGAVKGMAKIISQEARNAVKSAESGGGAGGQSGTSNKMAVGVYFKHRWKSLVVLGICLLYLVSGNIYSFVAWIIDLVSGFMGF